MPFKKNLPQKSTEKKATSGRAGNHVMQKANPYNLSGGNARNMENRIMRDAIISDGSRSLQRKAFRGFAKNYTIEAIKSGARTARNALTGKNNNPLSERTVSHYALGDREHKTLKKLINKNDPKLIKRQLIERQTLKLKAKPGNKK